MYKRNFKDFSNEDALYLLRSGAPLLDIRTLEEFCRGHIKGAILIPTSLPPLSEREMTTLKDQLALKLSELTTSKNTPIVIYCKKGKRALIAKKIIQGLGYHNVVAWGGVDEPPLKQLFDQELFICKCLLDNPSTCMINQESQLSIDPDLILYNLIFSV